MRGQAADIGERVDLDPQQPHAGIAGGELERDARQPQETGRIGRRNEAIDEGRLDLVEIGLRRDRLGAATRLMWRLPLDRCALGVRMIMSGTMRRMDVIMIIVCMVMIVSMAVIVSVTVVMSVRVLAHG